MFQTGIVANPTFIAVEALTIISCTIAVILFLTFAASPEFEMLVVGEIDELPVVLIVHVVCVCSLIIMTEVSAIVIPPILMALMTIISRMVLDSSVIIFVLSMVFLVWMSKLPWI